MQVPGLQCMSSRIMYDVKYYMCNDMRAHCSSLVYQIQSRKILSLLTVARQSPAPCAGKVAVTG